jgi:hypothetical protein
MILVVFILGFSRCFGFTCDVFTVARQYINYLVLPVPHCPTQIRTIMPHEALNKRTQTQTQTHTAITAVWTTPIGVLIEQNGKKADSHVIAQRKQNLRPARTVP